MSRRGTLLRLLADGELHSGEVLARALGVTRAAVGKQIQSLAQWGIDVESVARRGYRLGTALDFIDADALRDALAPRSRERLARLEVQEVLESTNSHLLGDADLPAGRFRACLAEYQTAGRGRRGRDWIQHFGSGLCLSFSWLFREPPAAPGTLSLAAGVAALRALAQAGVPGCTLKWPNDVLKDGGKLGGILSELRLEAAGPAYVVIGIGLNVRLPLGARAAIEAAGGATPADLATVVPLPSRTGLAALLIDAFVEVAVEFETHGFAPLLAEWRRADALLGERVSVHRRDGIQEGVARGITSDGALRVEIDGRIDELRAGEVSLRNVA